MPGSEPSNEAHICDSCLKSYQRRDLLLRHRRRCLRSTKPPTRRKACNACVQAKTKCCYTQPTCSRCVKRGIRCEYASATSTAAAISSAGSSLSDKDPPRPGEITDFPSLWSRLSPLGDSGADSWGSWNSPNFPWALDPIDLPSLPSSTTSAVNQVTLGSMPSFPQQSYSPLVEETALAPPGPRMPDLSPLAGLGSQDANNSSRASVSSPDLAANYVRRLLQYPRLLLQDDFYCPFLHRTLFNDQVSDMTILPHTSMAICCGSALTTKDGAGYAKRAMDAQRQSLIESYPTYHCLEQWDALHAMLLYEILEMGVAPVDESESWKKRRTRGPKSPFLSKMTQCFSRSYLETHDAALLPDTNTDPTGSWVKWAVTETARRTIFLANIVNFFSNRDPKFGRQSPYYEPLNDELIMKMPLPCSHALWGARTEDGWRKAMQMAKQASPAGSPGISDAMSTFDCATAASGSDPPIADGEQLPYHYHQPSLKLLFSNFSKDYLRANAATNAGFADSNELRSFIILCALEQFS